MESYVVEEKLRFLWSRSRTRLGVAVMSSLCLYGLNVSGVQEMLLVDRLECFEVAHDNYLLYRMSETNTKDSTNVCEILTRVVESSAIVEKLRD